MRKLSKRLRHFESAKNYQKENAEGEFRGSCAHRIKCSAVEKGA